MSVIALIVLLPTAVYMVLSTDFAADKLREIAQRELTRALGTEVTIGAVKYEPFSTLSLSNATVKDDYGKTALKIECIDARLELYQLITTGRLLIDYAVVDGLDLKLYKQTPQSPLNIAEIINRLKKEDDKKEKTKFDLALNTLRIINSRIDFHVLDQPDIKNKFDANHIIVDSINLSATASKISSEEVEARIRELSFVEKSGFRLENLKLEALYTPEHLTIRQLQLSLPESQLNFGALALDYTSPDRIKESLEAQGLDIDILEKSILTPSDLSAFVPSLSVFNTAYSLSLALHLTPRHIEVENFSVDDIFEGNSHIQLSGIVNNISKREELSFSNLLLHGRISEIKIEQLLHAFSKESPEQLKKLLRQVGNIETEALINGSLKQLAVNAGLRTNIGNLTFDGGLRTAESLSTIGASGTLQADRIDLAALTGDARFGELSTEIDGDLTMTGGRLTDARLSIGQTSLKYNQIDMTDFDTDFAFTQNGDFSLQSEGDLDGNGHLSLNLAGNYNPIQAFVKGRMTVDKLNLSHLGLLKNYEGYRLDTSLDLDVELKRDEWINGDVAIDNFTFANPAGQDNALRIKHFGIHADNKTRPNEIEVESDFINGTLEGRFALSELVPCIKQILHPVVPSLLPIQEQRINHDLYNDFHFNFIIDNSENLVNFFKLPFVIIYPVEIEGSVNALNDEITIGIDAPYLMKGDMIIEQTSFDGKIGGEGQRGEFYLTTQFPTKKGMMVLSGGINVFDDLLRTRLDWEIQREKPINGILAFDTKLNKDTATKEIDIQVDIEPSAINFGNDTWHFSPSTIRYGAGRLEVYDFRLATETQTIRIDGKCLKSDPLSEIDITLENVVLNTIFETLDINKALIGGIANGTLEAGGIFSSTPFVTCDNLHVENIGYNNCVLGDADIVARWDNDRKSFNLSAIVNQEDGRQSFINGDIFPASESLDISFKADKIKVGFMKPFMDAFADDVSGFASGNARIFGSFKYIDMEGDVFAENLGLKVGFTNTWYYATDSIHIVPGLIDIQNVTVRDVDGNTALLNGYVKHNFFKDPVFDFRVTNAENFLCYDVTPALSPDWYGKIYGNGNAYVTGSPGVVNIDVNMTTSEGSTFTFVLSDTEEAEQYNFLTFRDKNRGVVTDTIIQKDILPEAVVAYRDKMRAQSLAQNPPSVYNMNIQMDITPAAKIIIVMDPIGGDEIKSWGNGHMRMTYTSVGNELRMYGTYAIDRGSYNFTLQDIIVKDFIIREGSSITFTGDPYNASLDIVASYMVNANLSDLDESFLNDPELNRTNVPVHALLLVKGDMRQPNIDFDLEFPTLTSDVYRKVRSIISTEEMMNRQMIYLLALNRFYTPEYMSTTKGNELFSVASSTISSRLSSMLGKLSENWSISPNLRSDKGDFSDVQFDVALSSNLLNNRLRMNGNFGYRDKSLNTTQFIGDFDLEYLINRAGTWRLKAYNRFNDQTYFLRTAKTTQGVGIKFQREFDDMFGFLKHKKKDKDSGTENDAENETYRSEENNKASTSGRESDQSFNATVNRKDDE